MILDMNVIQGLRAKMLKGCLHTQKISQLLHALETLESPHMCSVNIWEKAGIFRVNFGAEIGVPPDQELILPMSVGCHHELQGLLWSTCPLKMAPFVTRALTGTVLIRIHNINILPLSLLPGKAVAELALIKSVSALTVS